LLLTYLATKLEVLACSHKENREVNEEAITLKGKSKLKHIGH